MSDISNIQNVEALAPYKTVSGTVKRGDATSQRASIIATTDSYMKVTNLTIKIGDELF